MRDYYPRALCGLGARRRAAFFSSTRRCAHTAVAPPLSPRPRAFRPTLQLYFVVMSNLFQTDLPIHRRFDLKGSWVGRRTKSHKLASDTCLKDLEALEQGLKIGIGEERRKALLETIRSDTQWLATQGVIDYSLLVGIHDFVRREACAPLLLSPRPLSLPSDRPFLSSSAHSLSSLSRPPTGQHRR